MHIWPPASAGPFAQLVPVLGLLSSWYFLCPAEIQQNSVGQQLTFFTGLGPIPHHEIREFPEVYNQNIPPLTVMQKL